MAFAPRLRRPMQPTSTPLEMRSNKSNPAGSTSRCADPPIRRNMTAGLAPSALTELLRSAGAARVCTGGGCTQSTQDLPPGGPQHRQSRHDKTAGPGLASVRRRAPPDATATDILALADTRPTRATLVGAAAASTTQRAERRCTPQHSLGADANKKRAGHERVFLRSARALGSKTVRSNAGGTPCRERCRTPVASTLAEPT